MSDDHLTPEDRKLCEALDNGVTCGCDDDALMGFARLSGTRIRELSREIAEHKAVCDALPLAVALAQAKKRADTLFDAIKHGDDEHQAWLAESIRAHFAGEPVERPCGKGSADQLAAAEADADRLAEKLNDVSRRIDESEEWWMSEPNRGGFDHDAIREAIAAHQARKG